MPHPDDLSPDEEQVRRLLADARHHEPLPPDVAARLDAVLADLRHEDPADPAPVPATRRPIDLAAARRRRNVRTWLVAAAAVVVVGVGINQLDLSGMSNDADSGSASSADSGADRPEAAAESESDAGEGGGRNLATEKPSGTEPQDVPDLLAGLRSPVRLESDRFGAQVTRLQTRRDLRRLTASAYSTASAPAVADQLDSTAYRLTCSARAWGRGTAVPARYDGDPGVLVFRKAEGDTQIVDLFLCGADDPERSITLPAP